MSDIADWVFECVVQFLKSPLWTNPVNGFIETHCHEFVSGEEENKLIYTELHNKFREMVDDLLCGFLSDLGVSPDSFVEAIKSGANSELSSLVSEVLFAFDDFPSFRALMEKKNIELDLEAMYEYARYQNGMDDDMTDEERFLFEMAIQASLGDQDINMKQYERDDAELLQALALSIAIEQERLLKEQLAEDADEAKSAPPRTVEEIHEEIRQQRIANVERAVQGLTAPVEPSVDSKKIVEKALAPLGEKRTGGTVFGAKGALPGISSSTFAPKPVAPPPTVASPSTSEPSFKALKEQAEQRLGVAPTTSEPTKEELEQRAAYFKAQREKLLQQKQKERAQELEAYQQKQQLPQPSAQPQVTAKPTESDATKEMRIALARRFKEDLIQESRKAAQ